MNNSVAKLVPGIGNNVITTGTNRTGRGGDQESEKFLFSSPVHNLALLCGPRILLTGI
ncbi:hypothetical protein ACFL27_04385 [candidate division CSSED10-310 bacterium]|uniref:Uncharacterized protein n=1 Tax=candidate division CSSED10-310 bacterium TaxID=2855610 RepID=A0ABV6YT97_UNCC1